MKLLKSARVALAVLVVSLCMMPAVAFAAPADGGPAVVYDGSAKEWHRGENLQAADVLANFSEVMPGDSLTQEFSLDARHVGREVTVYLRVKADEATLQALAAVPFKVVETASADAQEAVLAEGVLGDCRSEQARREDRDVSERRLHAAAYRAGRSDELR